MRSPDSTIELRVTPINEAHHVRQGQAMDLSKNASTHLEVKN